MHVGFDISQTGVNKAGCGYFAHALMGALVNMAPGNRYSIFPSFGNFFFDPLMPIQNPYPGRDVRYGPRHLSRESARAFWTADDVEARIGAPDIVHSNNFWCPTQLTSSRLIYTFYDMGFAIDPSWTTEANRIGCFEGVFRSAIAVDWVLAISEASRADYLRMFPHFPEDRIRVIYPCSRFADSSIKGIRPKALEGITENKFWLNVGTIEPRKNQLRLAEAYASYLMAGGEPMPLVFAGGKGWLMDDFQNHLTALGIENKVLFTGYVSDEELVWLYQNCYANLYPSLFEGFGLPILEGMQFGAPTLTSNTTSLPEVAGDAAILLPPENTEAWTTAMLYITKNKNERDQLRASCKEQAGQFSWKHSTTKLLELYEEAVSSPKRHLLK